MDLANGDSAAGPQPQPPPHTRTPAPVSASIGCAGCWSLRISCPSSWSFSWRALWYPVLVIFNCLFSFCFCRLNIMFIDFFAPRFLAIFELELKNFTRTRNGKNCNWMEKRRRARSKALTASHLAGAELVCYLLLIMVIFWKVICKQDLK